MLELIDELYKPIRTYRSSNTRISIFKEISDYHYRENYHSDLLAVYLKFYEAKYYFIHWLNNCLSNDRQINYEDYKYGNVEREEGKIDILLYSNEKDKAIIIENKSNNAGDQFRQIYRYFRYLEKQNITVEAIFYLNKNSMNKPDLSDLNDSEKLKIIDLLVIGKLVEDNSFVDNVLKNVMSSTNEIKLHALSQEIRDLFYTVTYGDANMEDLEKFVDGLKENDNLIKLQKIIQAYKDVPRYLADKYLKYMNTKNTSFKIWLYGSNVLVIDIKTKKVNFAIDIVFNIDNISFELFVRDGKYEYLEKLKAISLDEFPFTEKAEKRLKYILSNSFDFESIEEILNKIIKIGNIACGHFA